MLEAQILPLPLSLSGDEDCEAEIFGTIIKFVERRCRTPYMYGSGGLVCIVYEENKTHTHRKKMQHTDELIYLCERFDIACGTISP